MTEAVFVEPADEGNDGEVQTPEVADAEANDSEAAEAVNDERQY